jgi:methionyl-tRNA formyltransferase
LNCLFPSSGIGTQLFHLAKELFDLERTYIICDFLNENDIKILLNQNWKLLKLEQVLAQENDYVMGFLLWWPTILDEKIINKFKIGIVNFHPSYLPFGRGKDPYFWSIVNDEPFGISCHFIDKKIDGGSLILQKRIDKDWTDTGESLRAKAIKELKLVFKDWVRKIMQSDYVLKKIANLSVNYRNDMLNKSFVELDSQCTFREFLNLVRAKTNSDHIGVVFSDSDDHFQVKLQIEECPNGSNSKI